MSEPIQDPYVALARSAIEHFIRAGVRITPDASLPESMNRPAAAFVSLKTPDSLRGCIGTLEPTRNTVAEEIIDNAIRSATRDPRFPPVRADELSSITVSVDVLSAPEPCTKEELDPRHYGVIVSSTGRRGVLLPDLEGVHRTEDQIEIARRKAGIPEGTPLTLHRFTVTRHAQ